MLEVSHLYFDYTDKPLLKNVEFSLQAGQLMHVRGHNGSGKTTLLKILSGLMRPERGRIFFNGRSIWNDLAHYQQSLCYVGHKTGVSQVLTVRENCRFDLQHDKKTISFDELMHRFSLNEFENVPCGLLSMGQRRRVGLLRILMSDAGLWILDEPLVALDQDAIAILMDCFIEHLDKGRQIILTSHQTLPLQDRDCFEYFL